MGLNTRFISSKTIIDNVFRDTGYESEIPFADAIGWITEGLDKIAYPMQYIRKIIGSKNYPPFDFDDFRASVPCDFYKLDAIAVNGYNARPATNSLQHLLSGDCCDFTTIKDVDIFKDNFGNKFSPQVGELDTWAYPIDVTFDINNDYFTFSVKTGKACMAYYAYPFDEEGYPLVPDEVYYREAIKWYIISKLDYIEWRQNPSTQAAKINYENSNTEWLWYVAAAQNNAKMPDVGQMENLKNIILTYKPRLDHFNTFFRNLGQPEMRKNY